MGCLILEPWWEDLQQAIVVSFIAFMWPQMRCPPFFPAVTARALTQLSVDSDAPWSFGAESVLLIHLIKPFPMMASSCLHLKMLREKQRLENPSFPLFIIITLAHWKQNPPLGRRAGTRLLASQRGYRSVMEELTVKACQVAGILWALLPCMLRNENS